MSTDRILNAETVRAISERWPLARIVVLCDSHEALRAENIDYWNRIQCDGDRIATANGENNALRARIAELEAENAQLRATSTTKSTASLRARIADLEDVLGFTLEQLEALRDRLTKGER